MSMPPQMRGQSGRAISLLAVFFGLLGGFALFASGGPRPAEAAVTGFSLGGCSGGARTGTVFFTAGSAPFTLILTFHIPGQSDFVPSGASQTITPLSTVQTSASFSLSGDGVPANANTTRVEVIGQTIKSDSVPPCNGVPPTSTPPPTLTATSTATSTATATATEVPPTATQVPPTTTGTATATATQVPPTATGTVPATATAIDTATATSTATPTSTSTSIPTATGTPVAGSLTVIKTVINDNGGVAVPANFTMTINGVAVADGITSFPGSSLGVIKQIVSFGAYNVTESGVPTGYTATFSAGCVGTINPGDVRVCTVTNNDLVPVVILVPAPPPLIALAVPVAIPVPVTQVLPAVPPAPQVVVVQPAPQVVAAVQPTPLAEVLGFRAPSVGSAGLLDQEKSSPPWLWLGLATTLATGLALLLALRWRAHSKTG